MTLRQKLAPILRELSTTTLEFAEHKPNYPDDSLLDESLIFQSVMMDKIHENQNFDDMPFEQRCEMVQKCGEDFS